MKRHSNASRNSFILIIVLAVLGIVFYAYNKREAKAPTTENAKQGQSQNQNTVPQQPAQTNGNPQPTATTTAAPTAPGPRTQTNVKGSTGPDYTPGHYSSGDESTGPDIQVVEVVFDGTRYAPGNTVIRVGDWVFFKNSSAEKFWPVTASAATTAALPAFNPKAAVAPGGQYKFQFLKDGTFTFGDSLHPSAHFTVTVSK